MAQQQRIFIDLSDVSDSEEFPERSVSEWGPAPSSPICSQSASQDYGSQQRTRSQSSDEERRKRARRTYEEHILIYHDLQDLYKIHPPLVEGEDPTPYRSTTTVMGRYLIELRFPIIGHGTNTLVFLLTGYLVAKVAIYDYGTWTKEKNGRLVNHDYEARKHNRDRDRDVVMCQKYPGAYANTEKRLVSDSNGATFTIVIQERLKGPFHRHGPPKLSSDDELRLCQMIQENQDVKQFAKTAQHKLVGYDYE